MITFEKVRYTVIAARSDGKKIVLTDAITRAGWEENEKEIAVRANLTMVDIEHNGKLLSEWMPLCTRIYVLADWGIGMKEVFRGGIWQIEPPGMKNEAVVITAYDELYYCTKSDDSCYFASGTGTRSIFEKKLSEWKIPLHLYSGPNVKHDKLVFKSKPISSIFLEVLDDAKKNGGEESIIRMTGGSAEVIPICSNPDVYVFEGSNATSLRQTHSMMELVTKVVILGKAASSGKQKVEATVLGKTEYGIIQQTYDRNSESLSKAKKAAQDILDENGTPKTTVTIESVDLPFLRKGDKIYARVGSLNGFAKVLGVSHDIKGSTMTMEVKAL